MRHLALGVAAVLAAVAVGADGDRGDHSGGPPALGILHQAEIDRTPVSAIRDLLMEVPDVASYRFGDDPNGIPTLDRDLAPAATPDLLGVSLLHPGALGYGGLEAAIESNAKALQIAGDGLDDTRDYALFIATRGMPSMVDAMAAQDYYVQTDFLIGWDDRPGWQALDQYPGDTWQGVSLALTAQWAPDQTFTVSLDDTANDFAPVDFDGFYAVGLDWSMAAIDLDTLGAYGDLNLRYGFASHVHDGSYGQCETCQSIVTTYPAVPRVSTDLFGLVEDPWVTLAPRGDDCDEGGSVLDEWCFWTLVALGLLGVGLGAWWYVDYRAKRPWWPCTVSRRGWDRLRGSD